MFVLFEPISSISLSLSDTRSTMLMLPFSELMTAVLRELLAGGKLHPTVELFGKPSQAQPA
jgi:hypothetical protein